jgi:hypothetical protein
MIDPQDFERRQFELTAEFGKYVFDNPEVEDLMPNGAHVYFQIVGDEEFNQYSRELAERQRREERVPVVLVRIKGLAPPHGSRLIDPVIESASAVA